MRARSWIGCALLLCVAACGQSKTGRATEVAGGESDASPVAAPTGTRPAAAGAKAKVAVAWEDPEPAGAQALAESVLAAPWNRDKTSALQAKMTTLVNQTTGISGFATALAAKETSVEDRLASLGAKVTATEITIRLPGSVLFDFDSADLRADAERTLADLAQVLVSYAPRPARVEGHTDSIASDDYNQKLSERRAASVVKWLTGHGVAASRMSSAGLGESKPVADNATAAGRQQNRRVEVIIAKGG